MRLETFFFFFFFFFSKNGQYFPTKKKKCWGWGGGVQTAATRLALISSTRWTGNRLFFYGQPGARAVWPDCYDTTDSSIMSLVTYLRLTSQINCDAAARGHTIPWKNGDV